MKENIKKSNSYDVSPRHQDVVDGAHVERRKKDIRNLAIGATVLAITAGGAHLLGETGFTDPAGPPNPNAHASADIDHPIDVFQLPEMSDGSVKINVR